MKRIYYLIAICLLTACHRKAIWEHPPVEVEVLNHMTPIKDQGNSQTCWVYAMLAAIETEHIGRGDSVNLSPAYVEYMLRQEPQAPESKRGMAVTCIHLIQKYGLCAYDAYHTTDTTIAPPRQVFMLGAVYTPHEFARSVCAPDEYVALTSNDDEPYNQFIDIDLPDNWEHNRFWNIPMDTLVLKTECAVRRHHGVCWEGDVSERGFDWQQGVARPSLISGFTTDDHCMAIVGIAHDADGQPYFVMKNSWGTSNARGGLLYMSFDYFRSKTLAVVLPRVCLNVAKQHKK